MTLPWGIYIACDLFLGGVAGGAFLIGAVQDLRGKGEKVAKFAGFVSISAVVFELLSLFLDLGQPSRALNAFNRPTDSVMSFGTWTISLFALVAVVYTSFFFRQFPWSKSAGGRKVFAILGTILGLTLMLYTGILLGAVSARPLWNQALLPLLFTVNGVSTGIAVVEAAPKLMSRRNHPELEEETKGLERANVFLIGVQTFILISFLYTLFNSTTAASEAATTWLTGSLSLDFWAGFVTVGLVIPLLLYAVALTTWKNRTTPSALATVLAGVLVLAGGFILRYIVLGAGTNVDFLQGLGFVNQTVVSFGPTTTELVYTSSLFLVLAVVYAAGAFLMLRSKAGPQTTTPLST